MNPYNFVRIDWQKGVVRHPARPHNAFGGYTGKLRGTIEALSPLFIPESDTTKLRFRQDTPHLTNRHREPIIPGTSLKGLFRSLVETIGYGCWWLLTNEHARKLPRDFEPCRDLNHLCVACRMFGMIQGDQLLMGHVGFDDAVCTDPVDHPAFYTIILLSPKPRHTAFYLDPKGNLAGRKFYYHDSRLPIDMEEWQPHGAMGDKIKNQYIKPVGAGSVFEFSGHFDNLTDEELNLLLYAITLEDGVCHKIGYAKPAGLGSAKIRLTDIEIIDTQARYRTGSQGLELYEGNALEAFISERTQVYREDHASITLQDLREIWACEGRADLQYPSQGWFQDPANRQKRLHETP